MKKELEVLTEKKEQAKLGGGLNKIEKQHQMGFLTARERIHLLVDPGSFLELGSLAHSDQPGADLKSAGDGVVTGLAKVNDRQVVVQASDKTVFAGTEGMVYFRKLKPHEFAVKRGMPLINLMEGGGLRMPDGMGSDGISQMLFPQELLQHNRSVPMITAILGDSFGGPTWTAVSSDFVTQVKGTSMAVAGPRMLEVATGEKVTNEELGGWEVHAEYTGQVDQFAETEEEAIEQIKQFLSYVPQHSGIEPYKQPTNDHPQRVIDEVTEIVPTRRTRAYDMKKLSN